MRAPDVGRGRYPQWRPSMATSADHAWENKRLKTQHLSSSCVFRRKQQESSTQMKTIPEQQNQFQAQKEDVLKYCAAFSKLGDIYVNDAFGAVHRSHSSLVGCTLPIRAAGLLLKKELSFLEKALENPNRPFLVILGGSKVSDKIQVIDNLLDKVDALIVAGGMAFTFLKVINKMEIGKSLFDEKGSAIVNGLVAKAKQNNVKLLLPVDFITAPSICQNTDTGTATVCSGIPPDSMGLDIGAESVKMFSKEIRKSRTITWNGPPGVFEFEKFSHGSQQILQFVVEATMGGALTIIGGGDTATCCMKYKCENKVSYVSTGGGASLAVLKGSCYVSSAFSFHDHDFFFSKFNKHLKNSNSIQFHYIGILNNTRKTISNVNFD